MLVAIHCTRAPPQPCSTGAGRGTRLAPPLSSLQSTQPRSRASVHASATSGLSTPQQRDAGSLDVSGAVVQPAFRQTPWAAEAAAASTARAAARIAFVSESGVCRAVLAAAAFQAALVDQAPLLVDQVEAECRATRDFCLGEGADPAAQLVAAELGLELPQGYAAQQFKESVDIVAFDLVLAMDKFTAADVLREVSVFDTIKTWGKASYSSKVRRLGEFVPGAAAASKRDPEAADIQDALYGNVGGEEELQSVRQAAATIQRSCQGLVAFLAAVAERHQEQQQEQQQAASEASQGQSSPGDKESDSSTTTPTSARLGDALTTAVREMEAMEWLVPPMLQAR